jgi:hypothetical protein
MDNQISRFICLSNIPYHPDLFLIREADKFFYGMTDPNQTLLVPSTHIDITNYDNTTDDLVEFSKKQGYHVTEIKYDLPDWFLNFKGKRYIKVIGVHSNKYFKDDITQIKNHEAVYASIYNRRTSQLPPTLATLHSNLGTLINLEGLKINQDIDDHWVNFWGDTLSDYNVDIDIHNNQTNNYVMTVNQFFTPKVYQVDEDKLAEFKTIKFWFEDDKHNNFPVLSLFWLAGYKSVNEGVDVRTCELLEFRIEIELVCIGEVL